MPLGFLACRELLPGGRYLFDIGQTSDSLSLAMVLTTILTTIWVCPPKYTHVQIP
jgi:hypothetical protein